MMASYRYPTRTFRKVTPKAQIITPPAVAVVNDFTMVAAQGSYALTSQSVNLNILTPEGQGSYTLTGQSATLGAGMTEAQGSYTLNPTVVDSYSETNQDSSFILAAGGATA